MLRHYANLLEDAIGRVLDLMAAWIGETDGGTVEISGSIDADYNPAASLDVLVRMNAAGVLSNETLFEEAQKRGIISPMRRWADEKTRLELQGDIGFKQSNEE